MDEKRLKVIIVGGGPAGMMTAWQLADKFEVHLFDKESKIGKKFIVAGKGGLNITNSTEKGDLLSFYSPNGLLDNALHHFDNNRFKEWLSQLGINTYTGSSGKVFPEKGITAIEVLNKIKRELEKKGVKVYTRFRLSGFDNSMNFQFEHDEQVISETCDYAVLALGGASWPQTGSDGKWVEIFNKNELNTIPFQASNCGVNVKWPNSIIEFHEGKSLKNIKVTCGNLSASGEALITSYGLEGTAIYPIIPALREQIRLNRLAFLKIDFKPRNTSEQLISRLKGSNKYKERLALRGPEMSIIKLFTSRETFLEPVSFCNAVKGVLIQVESLRPIEEAISVVGGVPLEAINEDFSLVKFPKVYIAGEMLDWDAPTGGFLLQGCFSMGAYIGSELNKKVRSST